MAQTANIQIREKPTFAVDLKDRKLDPAGFVSENMRNICILAHVDHGKTCIADCLLTLNGLVNKRCIGKTKYLDDRPDEQDRKITMKSSAVSIGFHLQLDHDQKFTPFLINLVDTPGHIDFSTEVIAATRICDGALIVVDAVEGVLPQTKIAMKYAYDEKLKMILIINKFDRLILDLQLPVNDMFFKLLYIVEQCNSYIALLEEFDILNYQEEQVDFIAIEQINHRKNFFDPIKGNVIFASAIDSWGFTLRQIAIMYIPLIKGETIESLTEKLWDINLYVSFKEKKIKLGAAEKGIPNVFCQLICSMLNHIYTTLSINGDENAVPQIINKLGLDATTLPLKFYSCKMKLKLIMEAWNSLAMTIATQCYHHIPAPTNLDDEKINYLINLDRYSFCSNSNDKLQHSITSFKKCSAEGKPIAYITKLLVENKNTTPLFHEFVNAYSKNDSNDNSAIDKIILKLNEVSLTKGQVQIMALVRIYSGALRPGQKLTMINSDYNPIEYLLTEESSFERFNQLPKLTIKNVYVLLGPDCKSVECLGAGYICGITCFEDFPSGNVTLSDSFYTPPIIEQYRMEPIVYNVITPVQPKESQILKIALQMLQQFDTCLRTFINEFGEYVVTTAGKVHLEKCLMDLKRNFSNIDIIVSPPIYSLRETVEQIVMLPVTKTIEVSPYCKINIELSVVMLPKNIATVVQTHHSILNMIQNQEIPSIGDICARVQKNQIRWCKSKTFTTEFYEKVVSKLQMLFNKTIRENNTTVWNAIHVANIMRVSNSKDNINLIINDVTGYSCNLFLTQNEYDTRVFIYNYFVNAFNMACEMGPICKEPVSNCAFILNEFDVDGPINVLVSNDPLVGNHITQQFKQLFLDVILKEDIGVMEPMLEATIQTEIQWLGGIYSEVRKRFGQVLPFDNMPENSKYVSVRAYIPALDGEDFITGIRKITAGTATVFMAFSHYELTSGDVFNDEENEPTKKDRKCKLNNRAAQLVKTVRFRKGIIIHDQVVFHAEKQRTLKK